jgi:nucleotide-binding universal stress UspA family protein
MIALKRILVPTDFSESSDKAVTYGVALARAFQAKLFLLHVAAREDLELILERQRVTEAGMADVTGTKGAMGLDELVQSAERELMGKLVTAEDRNELQPEYVLRTSGLGGPYLEIVRYAKEREIDLIVMGTHGRGFGAHMLMGGVAEKMVRKAPCPVLTVRHPEHEFVLPDGAAGG